MIRSLERSYVESSEATMNGVVNKTCGLFALLLIAAGYSWHEGTPVIALGSALVGAILVFVTMFKQSWAPVTAPLYAVCEGLLIGFLSAVMQSQYQGIVTQAVVITFALVAATLVFYRVARAKIRANFNLLMTLCGIACLGVALFYLAVFVMRLFGVVLPYLHDGSPMSIGISLVIIGIATFSLVMDFASIDQTLENGAPKFAEWYCGMILMVTIVWLYIEILRLLAKLRR